jgi:hypothetical protein
MKLPLVRTRRVKPPDNGWDAGDPRTGLPVFRHHFHGMDLDWLGHEGSVIAHGHVPFLRFAAACDLLAWSEGRASPTFDWMAFIEDVRHGYAVHAFASTPQNWRIHWSDVDAGTPGAFPVTIVGTGM